MITEQLTSVKYSVTERGILLYKNILIDEDGCWLWQGATSSNGYGTLRWPTGSDPSKGVHIISYLLSTRDKLKRGEQVLHHCDKPLCIKPSCLFKGNHDINMLDRSAKGRQPHGENHYNIKISNLNVIRLRELYKTGRYKQIELALMFNLSQPYVSKLIRRDKRKIK